MANRVGWLKRRETRWLLLALLLAVPIVRAQQAPPPAEMDFQVLGGDAAAAPADSQPAAAEPASEPESEPAAGEAAEPEHGGSEAAEGEPAEGGEGEGEHEGGHSDPVGPVLLALAVILIAAKLGGAVFMKFNQPAVLGELVFGVLLGNGLLLFGMKPDEAAQAGGFVGFYGSLVHSTLAHGSPVDILARIGVVLLLFLVGLESNVQEMMKVGLSSLLVATLGVIAPFVLGFFTSKYMLPGDHDILVHVFIGATLCATSVGITARVLKELGRLTQDESKIILGAAVIDDVMGLVILAVVAGLIGAKGSGVELQPIDVIKIITYAVGFLVLAVVGGQWLSPRMFRIASRLRGEGLLLITALIICFVLAGAANLIGLAPIVGAFAAGLLLDEVHYSDFREHGIDHTVEHLVEPIAAFLVPVFFVQMGMTVDLTTFGNVQILGFAAVLTVVAILGKQVCSWGVLAKGLDKVSVGIGMIPRGEVGLIFAAIGHSLRLEGEPVIGPGANAAVVIMVIVTTMITPPVLQWSLRRGDAKKAQAFARETPAAE